MAQESGLRRWRRRGSDVSSAGTLSEAHPWYYSRVSVRSEMESHHAVTYLCRCMPANMVHDEIDTSIAFGFTHSIFTFYSFDLFVSLWMLSFSENLHENPIIWMDVLSSKYEIKYNKICELNNCKAVHDLRDYVFKIVRKRYFYYNHYHTSRMK